MVVTFYFILQTRMFGTFIYLSYFLCQRKYLTLYIILFKRYRNLAIYKVLYGRVIVRAPNHNLGSSRYTNKGLSLMIFKKNFAEYCRSSVHSNKIIYTSTNEKITIFLKSLIIKVALFFYITEKFWGKKRKNEICYMCHRFFGYRLRRYIGNDDGVRACEFVY